MNISKEEVLHIAALSYLKLSETEIARFQRDLSAVLDYINKLNMADTSGAAATDPPYAVPQRLREDAAAPSFPQADMLRNAPASSDGFILVPKVI
jgi:aspartyl-tRNA(Asn)/glutamyl-tRNA(Gln) amidotransferase subunit C